MIVLQDLSQALIKNNNQRRILSIVRQEQKTTKAEIAKCLKLSIPTVSSNITLLEDAGFLKQAEGADSTGGRPPAVIEFLATSYYSVGVEIKWESTDIIITDLNYRCVAREKLELGLKAGMGSVITAMEDWLMQRIAALRLPAEKILGVGFSLHGIVDEESLSIKFPFSDRWFDFSQYKKRFKWPVFLENEANLGAKAELEIGLVSGKAHDIVFLSINQGVGAGVVISDHLYKGRSSGAGEFGHTVIQEQGRHCRCGMLGCWEAYVSVPALEESYPEGRRAVSEIFAGYQRKEVVAVRHVEEYIHFLALGIRNIMLILDPDHIIIGGEMSLYAPLFQDKLSAVLQSSLPLIRPASQVLRISGLKQDASLLGAAMLPLESVFNLNNRIL